MSERPAANPVVFVIGTRAQLIKIAPVVVACEQREIACLLVMTGQHKETMQDLLDEFAIKSPQVDALTAAEHSTVTSLVRWIPSAWRGLTRQIGRLAENGGMLDVVVHGDTLSTLLGAFVARRLRASVIHVESGLSSGRLTDPFPEELIRRFVFRLTSVAFCPTPETTSRMRRFGCETVDTLGNTIIDAVRTSIGRRSGHQQPYIVASLHRFQNIYSPRRLDYLVRLLVDISSCTPVEFVLHPATRIRLAESALMEVLQSASNITLHPRLGYRAFLNLAAHAECVLTDGGSNQEELAALGTPTIIMRARTERRDGLGQNAIMEGDIAMGVASFIREGRHRALKVQTDFASDSSPSARIADALLARRHAPA